MWTPVTSCWVLCVASLSILSGKLYFYLQHAIWDSIKRKHPQSNEPRKTSRWNCVKINIGIAMNTLAKCNKYLISAHVQTHSRINLFYCCEFSHHTAQSITFGEKYSVRKLQASVWLSNKIPCRSLYDLFEIKMHRIHSGGLIWGGASINSVALIHRSFLEMHY